MNLDDDTRGETYCRNKKALRVIRPPFYNVFALNKRRAQIAGSNHVSFEAIASRDNASNIARPGDKVAPSKNCFIDL